VQMWTMIFLLALAGLIYGAWKHHYNTKNGINVSRDWMGNETISRAGDAEENARLKGEVEELRERIKVLERIATDDREARRLSSEIEKLRDE